MSNSRSLRCSRWLKKTKQKMKNLSIHCLYKKSNVLPKDFAFFLSLIFDFDSFFFLSRFFSMLHKIIVMPSLFDWNNDTTFSKGQNLFGILARKECIALLRVLHESLARKRKRFWLILKRSFCISTSFLAKKCKPVRSYTMGHILLDNEAPDSLPPYPLKSNL